MDLLYSLEDLNRQDNSDRPGRFNKIKGRSQANTGGIATCLYAKGTATKLMVRASVVHTPSRCLPPQKARYWLESFLTVAHVMEGHR